jgi:hypothetical protein
MATSPLAFSICMSSIALEPVINDPLMTRVPLPHEAVFFPYGFPMRIRSNSPATLRAADLSWGAYPKKFQYPPFDVRLLISNSDSPAQTEAPQSLSQGHLVSVIADAENFVCLDLNAGFGFGWATPATAGNTDYFRQCLLDVMVYYILEIRHLVILHAACVMFQGKGILLAGDSGAGKSSLAYACARRGWTYVSDDESALLRHGKESVVMGHPHRFRFRDSVGELFPELQGMKSSIRAFGKKTIEVNTDSLSPMETAGESPVDSIIFLNRAKHRSSPPKLSPLPAEEVWERLSSSLWDVQLPAYVERLAAVERLLTLPAFEICYQELNPAIDLLENIARTL